LQKDKKQTLIIAFELAEKHLKIPNILDPDYIASGKLDILKIAKHIIDAL
jgi:hypothetical protein